MGRRGDPLDLSLRPWRHPEGADLAVERTVRPGTLARLLAVTRNGVAVDLWYFPHDRSPSALDPHQPFRTQDLKRIVDGRPAHAELRGEIGFGRQGCPGGVFTALDRAAKQVS